MLKRPVRFRKPVTAATVLALVASMMSLATPAVAANSAEFDPGNIISDANFYDRNAMTESGVQSFLNQTRTLSCRTGYTCLNQYRETTTTISADSYCSGYTGDALESAARIITKVAQSCGISPRVLLVTLQKESSLVTATSPSTGLYAQAMGYACPDTAPCSSVFAGFFRQMFYAARQFNIYRILPTSFNYRAGTLNSIQFHPNTGCGSSSVYIQNQATAALYIYTPYQPNPMALANLYGTGDSCSSYGNRNFWRIYTDWFGSPTSQSLRSASLEGGSVSGWGASNGFINQQVYNDPSIAQDGSWFLAMNTPVAGRAMTQDVVRNVNPGDQVNASVWLRSESGAPFTGTVALWGLGGTTEMSPEPFTVGATWTEITVELPVRASAHSLVRLDIYMQTTTDTLWLDNAAMTFGKIPPPHNYLTHPSFEGSFDRWVPGNGFVNQQIYQDTRFVRHGAWFAASNTPVVGRSFAQTVDVNPRVGEQYTFDIWLRASTPGTAFPGQIALWGLGSSAPVVAVADYSAIGEWARATVSLTIPSDTVRQLKAEIYMGSNSDTIFLDEGQLARNLLTAASFEDGALTGWGSRVGTVALGAVNLGNPPESVAGQWAASISTPTQGNSVGQTVTTVPKVGERYIARVWVKSSVIGQPQTGVLALWATGGSNEGASTPFTAGDTWQLIETALTVTGAGHDALTIEVYLGTPNTTMYIDAAQLL